MDGVHHTTKGCNIVCARDRDVFTNRPLWAHMGPIWAHMGPIWAHIPENPKKILGNSMDFHGFPLWSHCGATVTTQKSDEKNCDYSGKVDLQPRANVPEVPRARYVP